ncbi:TolC family protein [Alkalilimnicola ehrlichii MLHE-1]|uniref:Outer membrane efflux protein n=1 Tax=Alkalilimnicola ehrlichii (strain ATCC BAA-1101 / DSM 17681 / MLHE-1) TaxID=187272 RepID=Q0A8V0_ALKEH|nr:TolC family protein [Alkalilimnicola ehrlichii]ABI56737.1 outer membrane efflux protein [Alkalilimnicola ehrlichii MLHE-1]
MHFLSPGRPKGLLFGVLLAAVPVLAPAQPALTLEAAENMALQEEPTIARYRERAAAREEAAVAAGALPDPLLITELMDVPADRPRLDGDEMTQFKVGLRQAFPRGQTRTLRQERGGLRASQAHARGDDAERAALNAVRQAYLRLYNQRRAVALLEGNRSHFEELLEITERALAAGRVSRQDVIRAELELERLEDRLSAARAAEADAESALARWIGPQAARRPLPDALPELALPDDNGIDHHPLLQAQDLAVADQRRGVDLARQGYRPEWSVELTYGMATGNDMDAPDRLSAMVVLDLPLFTRNRQDRDVAASRREVYAAKHDREVQHRTLTQALASQAARWQRLRERERRFEERLLIHAADNVEAAEQAYRAGTLAFTALMQARITYLETHLDAVQVATDRRMAQAELLYLSGATRR